MCSLKTTPAVLPNVLLEGSRSGRLPANRVETMKIGETSYTLPWAMEVTKGHQCYLNGHYPTTPYPYKTSTLKVTRTLEGYVVDVPDGCFFKPVGGVHGNQYIPVLQVVTTR